MVCFPRLAPVLTRGREVAASQRPFRHRRPNPRQFPNTWRRPLDRARRSDRVIISDSQSLLRNIQLQTRRATPGSSSGSGSGHGLLRAPPVPEPLLVPPRQPGRAREPPLRGAGVPRGEARLERKRLPRCQPEGRRVVRAREAASGGTRLANSQLCAGIARFGKGCSDCGRKLGRTVSVRRSARNGELGEGFRFSADSIHLAHRKRRSPRRGDSSMPTPTVGCWL